ncbi:MAG TPA: class F sortase [Mycobacteriales bacterium]|nr:class F sortase [Mycobacteriales bacterium]
MSRLRTAAATAALVMAATACGDGLGEHTARRIAPAPTPSASSPTSPSPTLATPVAALPRSAPVRLRVASIGVDTPLIRLGLQADRTMEVPPDAFPAGWYGGAPTPGELGPAIIAGHVDWAGRDGVFHDLHRLRPGDEVAVSRADGSTATFRVERVEQLRKDRFPTDAVYGDIDHAGLRLITCGGTFDPRAHSYVDNIIVFARLVRASPATR